MTRRLKIEPDRALPSSPDGSGCTIVYDDHYRHPHYGFYR